MICDFCHEREAVIFMEQMTGIGQRRKINICLECAMERGISPDPKNIESSIGNLFKELTDVSKKISEKENRICPVCGTSLGEIRKTGKAGCPECYAIFKNDIRQMLENNGVKDVFKGTMPARLSTIHSVLNDRVILQNKLNDALSREDYEKAAMYRDYLKALEKQSVSDGSENGQEESE
ncbi:MAG: UvrB/UvrC motif-containing protein [Spirochaetia bacterium]|nr:UvrB/UvrC motif-containing protein [Spirochaetia bacterium]